MDSNKPNINTQQSRPTQTPVPNVPPQPVPAAKTDGSKKMVFLLIGGVVLIIMIIGVIYWLLNKQQTINQSAAVTNNQSVQVVKDTLDQDLKSIDVQASDSADFDALDRDLQNL